MSAENKAVVRRFYEAWGNADDETLRRVLAPDLQANAPGATVPATRDEHLEGIRSWHAAFADSYYTIEDQLAEGERVASRVTLRAVHSRGEFMGAPARGERIETDGITIERIRDGQIVERRISYDQIAMLQQLGLIPPPQAAGAGDRR